MFSLIVSLLYACRSFVCCSSRGIRLFAASRAMSEFDGELPAAEEPAEEPEQVESAAAGSSLAGIFLRRRSPSRSFRQAGAAVLRSRRRLRVLDSRRRDRQSRGFGSHHGGFVTGCTP